MFIKTLGSHHFYLQVFLNWFPRLTDYKGLEGCLDRHEGWRYHPGAMHFLTPISVSADFFFCFPLICRFLIIIPVSCNYESHILVHAGIDMELPTSFEATMVAIIHVHSSYVCTSRKVRTYWPPFPLVCTFFCRKEKSTNTSFLGIHKWKPETNSWRGFTLKLS